MRIDNERESDNVEDRRGSSQGGRRGAPSMQTMMMLWPFIKPLLKTKFGWVVIGIGTLAYFSGFDPIHLLDTKNKNSTHFNQKVDDKQAIFIKKVLSSTENIWNKILPQYGLKYREPIVVLYRNGTHSKCGQASSQMGPFYCPSDEKVYLDLEFFNELSSTYNSSGDFAQAYVLAHEIGHHIQNIQGTLNKVQKLKQRVRSQSKSNALQVKVELQADCYAGAWAYHAHKQFNILEKGDVQEALQAASSIGDDNLMKASGRAVRVENFTHGSSKQRVKWFKKGLESGDLRVCNTFG